ncbi:MAG: mannosyltransferase family protein [Vicinamibacteraceae bacterium]
MTEPLAAPGAASVSTASSPPEVPPGLAWWVRLLDVSSGVATLLLISIVVFGGFRLRYGDLRITAQDVWRPLVALIVFAGARHWLMPRPSWPVRMQARLRAAWAAPVTRVVLPALLASRLMVLVVGYLGVAVIGYPDKLDPPNRVSSYEWVNLPVRWDAGWYLGIALNGYDYDPNARTTAQQNVAFFPAYPMAMRAVTAWLGGRIIGPDDPVSGNRIEWQYAMHRRALAAGLLISVGAFGWGLVYLFRLVRALGGDETAAASAVVLACAWPCALFYSAVYSEGLFFLGVLGAWYHLRERQWAWAFVWGLITGLSRPNGFLVSVPLALLAVADWRALWRNVAGARRAAWLGVLAAAGPGVGMLIYSAYLDQLAGHPLAWMEAHQAWGRVATDVAGLFTERADIIANQGFYVYSIGRPIELINATFVVVSLLLAVPITRRFGLAYGVFLVLMIAPPLFRGGFLSLGRLTSTLFPLFLYLGWHLRGTPLAAVVIAFAGVQALLAVVFFTWRPFF